MKDAGLEAHGHHAPEIYNQKRTDMTITGKLNPEDDTIFLKVQIADKEGKDFFFSPYCRYIDRIGSLVPLGCRMMHGN